MTAIAMEERPQRVYVCHPFSDDPVGNAERVRELCRKLVAEGVVPIAPHIYLPQFVDEATQRDLAMELCLDLLSVCDALWVFGWRVTTGMSQEISHAVARGIPVRRVVWGGEA